MQQLCSLRTDSTSTVQGSTCAHLMLTCAWLSYFPNTWKKILIKNNLITWSEDETWKVSAVCGLRLITDFDLALWVSLKTSEYFSDQETVLWWPSIFEGWIPWPSYLGKNVGFKVCRSWKVLVWQACKSGHSQLVAHFLLKYFVTLNLWLKINKTNKQYDGERNLSMVNETPL